MQDQQRTQLQNPKLYIWIYLKMFPKKEERGHRNKLALPSGPFSLPFIKVLRTETSLIDE